jgi:hypothetical protein
MVIPSEVEEPVVKPKNAIQWDSSTLLGMTPVRNRLG